MVRGRSATFARSNVGNADCVAFQTDAERDVERREREKEKGTPLRCLPKTNLRLQR